MMIIRKIGRERGPRVRVVIIEFGVLFTRVLLPVMISTFFLAVWYIVVWMEDEIQVNYGLILDNRYNLTVYYYIYI